jgi:hypothetical protein
MHLERETGVTPRHRTVVFDPGQNPPPPRQPFDQRVERDLIAQRAIGADGSRQARGKPVEQLIDHSFVLLAGDAGKMR